MKKIISMALSIVIVLLMLPFQLSSVKVAAAGTVTIEGIKKIEGIDAPDGMTFTFELTQVNDDGSAYTGSKLVVPSPLTASVTTPGPYNFEFAPITGLTEGIYYYFKIEETNNGLPGWTYDNYYIVAVIVEAGDVIYYYPHKLGDVTATSGGYTYSKPPDSNTIYYKSSYYDFTPNSDGYGMIYELFCADKFTGAPGTDDKEYPFFHVKNHTPSAFAYALYTQLASNSSSNEFLNVFGFTGGVGGTYPFDTTDNITLWERCKHLSALLIWYYEFRTLYPEYEWDPADVSSWPDALPSKPYPFDGTRTLVARSNIHRFADDDLLYYSLDYNGVFVSAVKTIDAMMANYDTSADSKCVTSLEMIYESDSDSSGWISFDYEGYIPPSHPLTLVWDITNIEGMTVTIKDGGGSVIYSGSVSGTKTVNIEDKFYIEYSGTGSVTFTLEDDLYYLMNGSIEGQYYISSQWNIEMWRQRMLIGFAQFAKMKCELEIGRGDCMIFRNKYGDSTPTPLTTWIEISGEKVINGTNPALNGYGFKLTEVDQNGVLRTDRAVPAALTATSGVTGAFTFDKINGIVPGTYYFKIEETGTAPAGWTYASPKILRVIASYSESEGWDISQDWLTSPTGNATDKDFENIPPTTEASTRPTVPSTAATEPETTTESTTEPETTTEPVTEPTIEETTEAATEEETTESETEEETESSTEPTIETTAAPTEPVTTETATEPTAGATTIPTTTTTTTEQITDATEPATTAGTVTLPEGIELFEEMPDGAVPLTNGWFAVYLDEDWWEIFDEDGVPLGVFKLSDDTDITEVDIELIETNLIPLANTVTLAVRQPARANPKTGDSFVYILSGLAVPAIITAALKYKPRRKEIK